MSYIYKLLLSIIIKMNLDTLNRELLKISRKLDELNALTPDMTFIDFEHERGQISTEEWENANRKSQEGVKLQNVEVAKTELLRNDYPLLMEEWIRKKLDNFTNLQEQLKSIKYKVDDFHIDFHIAISDDLMESFSSWMKNKNNDTWLAWTWRIWPKIEKEITDCLNKHKKKLKA